MEDSKGLVVIKILSELQQLYEFNNMEVKGILDRNLENYILVCTETSLMVSDIQEKIYFFIGLKRMEGLAEKSLESYVYELNMFSRFIHKPVAQITINDLRSYLATTKQEHEYENITVNNKISVLRSFFGTLVKEEIIEKDPTLRLKNLKVNKKTLRKPLSAEELEVVRNSCETLRDRTIIEFFVSTGCRLSEVLNVKPSEINWNNNSLIVIGKGNKERRVYFSVKCKLLLQEYFAERTDDYDILFLSEKGSNKRFGKSGMEKVFRRISEVSKVKVTPHKLRHTMASLAKMRGMDMSTIQNLLGHESIATTEIYVNIDEKQLQIAYEKYVAA
jgi:integrase/recombinase XerD